MKKSNCLVNLILRIFVSTSSLSKICSLKMIKDKLNNPIAAIFKEIIDATSYDYSTEKFKHGKFLNLLSKLTRKEQKLNIVTTNYDFDRGCCK